MTRKVTNQILEMVQEGIIDKDALIMACLKYMSENEVADMAHANDFLEVDDGEDTEPDDSMDGDHDSALASAGFGTDEDYGYYGSED